MIKAIKKTCLYASFYCYHIRISIINKIMIWLDKRSDKLMIKAFDIINELEKMEEGLA